MHRYIERATGTRFAATSSADLVTQMHAGAFVKEESDTEYMRQSALRLALQIGKTVRSESVEEYVEDLLGYGILIEEQEQ